MAEDAARGVYGDISSVRCVSCDMAEAYGCAATYAGCATSVGCATYSGCAITGTPNLL